MHETRLKLFTLGEQKEARSMIEPCIRFSATITHTLSICIKGKYNQRSARKTILLALQMALITSFEGHAQNMYMQPPTAAITE